MDHTPLVGLAVALFAGVVIGVERGWRRREDPEGSRVAGVRTIVLIGLAGGVTGLIGGQAGALIMAAGAIGVVAVLLLRAWQSWQRSPDIGSTTLVACLLTYLLGALATTGQPVAAGAAAVLAAWVLSLKAPLHTWLVRLEREELFGGLQLLLIAVVILPMLPDRGFGPYDAINPFRLWSFVTIIAAVSVAAYVAIKLLGPGRGILFAAVAGGMVSSTATSISLARQARDQPGLATTLGAGIVMATTVTYVRVGVIAALVDQSLARAMVPTLGAMIVTGVALVLVLLRLGRTDTPSATVPAGVFHLGTAINMGIALALILILARSLHDRLGAAGLYVVSVAAGLADVDAVTLSSAELAAGGMAARVAIGAILLAIASNAVVKAGIVTAIAGGRTALLAWLGLVVSMLAGALVFLLDLGPRLGLG